MNKDNNFSAMIPGLHVNCGLLCVLCTVPTRCIDFTNLQLLHKTCWVDLTLYSLDWSVPVNASSTALDR